MRALIIGGTGFVGGYLVDHLVNECGWSVAMTETNCTISKKEKRDNVSVYNLNILHKDSILKLLQNIKPDYIFHLAAQSSVSLSWKKPTQTIDVNITGSINLLDAARELDYTPRIMLIGSGEEYGHILPDEIPIKENTPTRPGNIYAATKVSQNMIGKIYTDAYQMDIVMVRAFNHIGPKQSPLFVVSDFCKQVAEIEVKKLNPIIMVGNLSAKRDFTDVRDVVRAYALLIRHGVAGETYNVGSGKAVSIEDILKMILSYSSVDIQIKIDENKLRPVDIPIIEADVQKLQKCTNWKRKIILNQTILDSLEYWRNVVSNKPIK